MKKTVQTLLTSVLLLALLSGCNNGNETQNNVNDTTMNSELTPFDVQKDFADNGFTFFTKNLILCCGDSTESNGGRINLPPQLSDKVIRLPKFLKKTGVCGLFERSQT